jgi:hypothetical protein
LVSRMDILRVYMMKASKTFEGTTAEICFQIGEQINFELTRLSQEKIDKTVEK